MQYYQIIFFFQDLSGNIETNGGQRRNLNNRFISCHCNLNDSCGHSFAKVQLVKAYLALRKFNIVCLSKTYLNSSFSFDDDNFDITDYSIVKADHPANSRFLHESIALGF